MTDSNLYAEIAITWTGLIQAHDLPMLGLQEDAWRKEADVKREQSWGWGSCRPCRSPQVQHTRAMGGENLLPSPGIQSQKDSMQRECPKSRR